MKVVVCLVLAVLPLFCQVPTGTFFGSVRDPQGMVIPGAAVTATHESTGQQRHVTTSEGGDFVLAGLEPGLYTIRVSNQGFKQTERTGIRLATGERLSLGTITLELGALTETVTVTAASVAVQTRSAERADILTPQQIENLQVLGRNHTDLVQLLPGVVMANPADQISTTQQFSVQGSRVTANNIAIDGLTTTDMGNGFQMKMDVSQDAVAEVRIVVSNYQAEYGRMSGSSIQVVTKSGTREFHGLASYFKRHEQFNANSFFNNRNGQPRSRYRFNTWSYNVNGPVSIPGLFNRKREKLFFSWGQEYWPSTRTNSATRTVPTEAERAGDYSATLDVSGRLIAIRDPDSKANFPGNKIPPARLDPSGTALLKIFPAPNFFDRNISKGNYNYTVEIPADAPRYTHSLKIDYNINSNNTVSAGLHNYKEWTKGTTGASNWPLVRTEMLGNMGGLSGRYTRIFSPTLINELNAGVVTQPLDMTYSETEIQRALRDKTGFTAGQFNPANNKLNLIPNASFGGVPSAANLNFEGRFPRYNRYYMTTLADSATWIRGPHTFKAGLSVEIFRRTQVLSVPFNGAFDFARTATNPLDTNWAYSNASLGNYTSYNESTQRFLYYEDVTNYDWYVQDNWKVFRNLTLDYGVRFSINQPFYEREDRVAGFVPSRYDPSRASNLIWPGFDATRARVGIHPVTGKIYYAAQIGAIAPGVGLPNNGMAVDYLSSDYPRGLMRNRGVHYAPRVGFAWDVLGNGRTAVRGGFGIAYNRFFDTMNFYNMVGQQPIVETPLLNFGQISQLLSSAGLLYPTDIVAVDAQGLVPQVMNFSLSVQRDIGFGTLLDIGYAGSLGRHLYWRRDINSIPLGANFEKRNEDPTRPGNPLPAPFLRPYRGYNGISMSEGGSSSNYHSLQASARRRFQRGLEFGVAYTWSKALVLNDGDTDSVSSLVNIRTWYYGLAAFDRTHVLNVNYVWSIPSPGRSHPVVKQILGGWQISGISRFTSGAPSGIGFTTTTAVDTTGTPSLGARIVVLENPVLPKSERTFSRNFKTEVFRLPAVGTIGNAAPTLIRGPGVNNWDISLFKSFPLREGIRVQFRWELYNAFNHTQFAGLDTAARFDPRTGEQVNTRFGEFTAARTPRQMQFALRFFF